MAIFKDNCTAKMVTDLSVPLLLLIQTTKKNITGTDADQVKSAFDRVNIMNFSAKTTCDIQLDRNASGGFTYNTFGKGLYYVTLEGFQTASNGDTLYSKGDIESYYNRCCMAGAEREKIRITASYVTYNKNVKDKSGNPINNDVHAEAITYVGYMTDFIKKPLGTDKIPGYGFTLSLVCTAEPRTK